MLSQADIRESTRKPCSHEQIVSYAMAWLAHQLWISTQQQLFLGLNTVFATFCGNVAREKSLGCCLYVSSTTPFREMIVGLFRPMKLQ
jgi:hypothetical protein